MFLSALFVMLAFRPSPQDKEPPRKTVTSIIHNGWWQADEFLTWDESQQRLYATGLLDGFYMSPFFGAPDNNKGLISLETCIESMKKSSQVAATVEHYIKEHPEHWKTDLKDEAYSALRSACPIK